MRAATLFVLCTVLLTAGAGWAQSGDTQSPFKDNKIIQLGPSDDQKLAMARRYLGVGRYQEAADLLGVIFESKPDDLLVASLLRTCYDQLEQYDQAERLARKMIELDPASMTNRYFLAELLEKQGRSEEASSVYDEIEGSISHTDKNGLTMYIKSLMRVGLDDLALQKIDTARAWLNDSLAFSLDRGEVMERRRDYREAARSYLPIVVGDTLREARVAERKLLALLEFDGSSGATEKVLVERADSTAGLRLMRLLADYYLKADRFDEAFSYTLRQDSLEGMSGQPLIAFMQRCHERRKWNEVIRMAETILAGYPDSPYRTDVAYEYAAALANLGRAEEAIAAYRKLAATAENDNNLGDALYGIAVVYMEHLNQYDSALVYFDSVVTAYPRGSNYLNARRAVPLIYIRLGYLDPARQQYESLVNSKLPERMAEESLFRLGLVEFFESQYDSANVCMQKVMVDYPRGYFVNDALRIRIAIQDAAGDNALLDGYAEALLMEYRGEFDSAITRYRTICAGSGSKLGDISLYRIMQLELGRADSTAVLEAADRLDEEFPESYYRPLGLKMKADILAARDEESEAALEIYRQLLESFPDYPFSRQVREQLRQMEGPEPTG